MDDFLPPKRLYAWLKNEIERRVLGDRERRAELIVSGVEPDRYQYLVGYVKALDDVLEIVGKIDDEVNRGSV